ncbi:MAG: ComEC family competence protein [Alphaproteobacteria bacterium]|nr:MAG: ComEC family competence protein [Alphaproteobacteria bacterium]
MSDLGAGAGRTRTWDVARPRGVAWPTGANAFGGAREILSRWLATDTAAGRLLPWLPICFGLGVVLYFTAAREPSLWAALPLVGVLAAATFFARSRPVAFPLLLGVTAVAAGFAIATVRTARIAHPILQHTAWNIPISGFVEVREEREKTDRIVVRVHTIEGRLRDAPERVRLSVKKHTAPPVGAFIEVKTRLNPPLRPLRPGGYDFSRDLYFQQIGATGFVLGAIKTVDPPTRPGAWLRYATFIENIRDGIDKRIRADLSGDVGAIASALITGKRDAISAPVNDAMYISGLGHVLSISGYHMALVAGVVFFTIRALLALVPVLAMRYPIKKWAAGAALVAAFCYLLLSGAEVATQRSFIMTAILLVGVMVDRSALTLRNLALAAVAVMLLFPEAVAHPSFQMSFAATLALIAAYERSIPWLRAGADTPLGARIALWGGREAVALIVVSLAAGTATMPYVAFHFHRLGPYGVLANLMAMPIVSVWVMPAGLLALLALPFGFDAPLWKLMGLGIDWMIWVALFVASLSGAVGRMTAFGTGPLLLCTAGLVVLCLLRSPLRWSGAVTIVVAALWAVRVPLPDAYVADRGDVVAVRGPAGRLSVMRTGNSDAFSVREWLAADADVRTPSDASLKEGTACDEIGCVGRLADGTIVALPFAAEALEEDCRQAALVVSQRTAPPWCTALTIDRTVWPRTGSTALYRVGTGWQTVAAFPPGYDRPWARAPAPRSESETTAATRPAPRDATPRTEDLSAED